MTTTTIKYDKVLEHADQWQVARVRNAKGLVVWIVRLHDVALDFNGNVAFVSQAECQAEMSYWLGVSGC
jgi:hypothetical protein